MFGKDKKVYLIFIGITEAIGILAGILSARGTEVYSLTTMKPVLAPPAIVFPIVWTLLYALMGFGAARVYLKDDSVERSRGLNLYVVQLIVNFFWPLLFFNAQAFGFSLLWLMLLWSLVILMIRAFLVLDKTAALLQIPYLIWLTFALYLNVAVWLLNS